MKNAARLQCLLFGRGTMRQGAIKSPVYPMWLDSAMLLGSHCLFGYFLEWQFLCWVQVEALTATLLDCYTSQSLMTMFCLISQDCTKNYLSISMFLICIALTSAYTLRNNFTMLPTLIFHHLPQSFLFLPDTLAALDYIFPCAVPLMSIRFFPCAEILFKDMIFIVFSKKTFMLLVLSKVLRLECEYAWQHMWSSQELMNLGNGTG